MAHVTLIRPPALCIKYALISGTVPPLGLAYVAGTLRAHGHSITCIDAPGEAVGQVAVCSSDPNMIECGLTIPEIVARIPAHTNVIGISCMFSFDWFHVMNLIRAIRAAFPTQFIVLGGEHASADHDYILRSMPEVDGCVLGEGEEKMAYLVKALEDGVPKVDLPGAAVYDPATKTVRKNDTREGYRIAEIDSIPRPAWDLLPIEAYFAAGYGFFSQHQRTIPMLASRGCPYRCTFCSSPQMWTTRWKARDLDDLMDEIKTYVRLYRITRVEFYDLSAIIEKQWIVAFCERLIQENLGITWSVPAGTRTEGLTAEVLALIKKSGCSELAYPLETGNPKVSERIKKKINYSRSLQSMRNAVKAGIVVKTYIIVGFPFESYWDILIEILFTIRLAWIGCWDVRFHIFMPYPGSELHNQLVAEGRIVKDENYPSVLRRVFLSNFSTTPSWSPQMTGKNLRRLSLVGMAGFNFFQFLFRPLRLIALSRRLYQKRPATTLELALSGTVPRLFRQSFGRLFGWT